MADLTDAESAAIATALTCRGDVYAVVADLLAAARADDKYELGFDRGAKYERERLGDAVERIADLYPPEMPPFNDYERGRRDAYANARTALRAVLAQPTSTEGPTMADPNPTPAVRHPDWLTDDERDSLNPLLGPNQGQVISLVAHIKAHAVHTARVTERKKVTADMLAWFTHLTECGGEECNCWAPDAAVQHIAEAMPWHVQPSERPS